MSKRKRASNPEPDESTDDAGVKDDMAHVSADMLAGSPDIFAAKKSEPDPAPAVAEEQAHPVAVEEPAAIEESPVADQPQAAEAPEPAPPPPAPFVNAVPQRYQARRRGASSTAIGIVLVVIGILAILGIVLAYSNSTGDWPIWAYAWSLVIPFGLGLGMFLQGLRDRDQIGRRTGRNLMYVGLMIFLIGFVLFESILGVSGRDYFGPIGKAALPLLLILVGVILLVRSMQRSRSAR